MTSIDLTISEWLDAVADTRSDETARTYTYAINVFRAWLAEQQGVNTFEQLNIGLLKQYVRHLLKRRLADRTRQQYVDVVCRWITALVESGEAVGIPNERGRTMSPVGVRASLERMLPRREPAVAPRMPDLRRLPAYYADQIDRFVETHGADALGSSKPKIAREYLNLLRNQALITVLFSSGGRVNEILSIDVTHLFRFRKLVDAVPIQGKGRKKRAIYLGPDTREAIQAYLHAREALFPAAVPLFVSHGPRAKGERLSDVTAWRIVKEAAEALADQRMREGASDAELAALRNVSPHGLRHFFAQSMLDEGADYKDIAGALGHSSTKVTEQVYARQSEDEILEVIATFAARPIKRFRHDDDTGS